MQIPRSMIEAGARALYDAEPNYEDDPVCPWEKLGPGTHKRYMDQAEAAIRAAIGCAKIGHVYIKMPATLTLAIGNDVGSTWKLNDGDTILIVRAEKGVENGAG